MSTAYSSANQKYIGNGVTTEWGFDFPIKKHSELKVYLKRSGQLQVLLEEGVDYSFVTENTIAFPIKTGEAKLQATDVLALQRESVFESEYNFSNQQRLEPEEVMHADDNLERQIQELKRDVTQAIRIQPTSNINTDEYFIAVESIYENLDNINNVSEHSSEIITCSNNIEAIQDAPNQANAAAQSASDAAQSASDAANSATASANSATASATSAQAAQDALNDVHGLIATPIGTIFQSVYVDESLDIARQLNGQLISSTKFTGFRSWLNTVQTATPNLFTTETNWQAEKTNSKLGQCGKFVVDDTAGTIRLPCVVNAQGLVDLALIGGIKSESLPNITGYATIGHESAVFPISNATDGCFSGTNSRTFGSASGNTTMTGFSDLSFNASRSSSTYQDNAPVQQEAVQYPYYIQVATGVEETLPAIREYNINTPFFFGQSMYSDVAPDNASWLASNGQYNAKTVYPDYYDWLLEQMNAGVSGFVASTATYTDYDFVINTENQTFRLPLLNGEEDLVGDRYDDLTLGESGTTYAAPANGYVSVGGPCSGYVSLYNSNGKLISMSVPDKGYYQYARSFVPVSKGNVFGVDYEGLTVDNFRFIYAKGNGSLYYYVGDTVQDASLINAGAVLGQLSNKADIDASNFNADGKSLLSGLGMPSNRYIDLTLGASGSTYTAPANGWFVFGRKTTNPAGCGLSNKTTGIGCSYVVERNWTMYANVPAKKGDVVSITYWQGDSTTIFRFIYAEGEQ